ncbi:MAG: alpha/beta hydrolase [Candidatus Helarchaeota archaeon]
MKFNKKIIFLIISLVIIIVGIIPVIYLTFFGTNYNRYDISLTSKDGTLISGWLYIPNPTPTEAAPVPGIVVTHGFTSSKVSMQGFSIEFVKRGFVIVAIDYRGHGMSGGYLDDRRYTNESPLIYDLMAAVNYLRSLPYVDNKSIAILGHSMGGITAIQAGAMFPDKINATISIGAILNPSHGEGTVNVSLITNFMIGVGALEELFTVEDTLQFMKNYSGISNPQPNILYGDFIHGNATKLVVSPKADHILEINDKILIESSIEWLENSFYGAIQSPIIITEQYRSIFLLIAGFGVLLGYFPIVAITRKALYSSKPLIRDISKVSTEINLKSANTKVEKLKYLAYYSLLYICGTSIGIFLHFPLTYCFESTIPKVMASLFIGIFVGLSIGLFLIYLIIKNYIEKDKTNIIKYIYNRLTRSFRKSVLMGVIIFFYLFAFLTMVLQIAFLDVVLVIRELGVFLSLGFLIFPYFIIDELLLRQLQDKLNIKNKYIELFFITFVESTIKIVIFFPLILLSSGFSVLIVAILIVILPIMQFLSTWLYIYSDRNPLTSAISNCLFMAWFLTFLMPFGTLFYSIL